MNFRIITKNHAADPEIGFLPKSILKPNGCATAIPTAWELKKRTLFFILSKRNLENSENLAMISFACYFYFIILQRTGCLLNIMTHISPKIALFQYI